MANATASFGLLLPTREVVMAQGGPILPKSSIWRHGWPKDFIAAGAQTLVLRFGGPDQFGQLERCATEVLPQVRAR